MVVPWALITSTSSFNDCLPTPSRAGPSPRLDSIQDSRTKQNTVELDAPNAPGRKLRLREGCDVPFRVQVTQRGMVTDPWVLSDALSGVGFLDLDKVEPVQSKELGLRK